MILQFVLTDSIITLQSIPNRILILITLSGYEYEKSYPPWLMGGLWVWGLNRPITIRTNPYPLDPPHTSLLHFYKVLIYIDFVYFYRKLLTKIKEFIFILLHCMFNLKFRLKIKFLTNKQPTCNKYFLLNISIATNLSTNSSS